MALLDWVGGPLPQTNSMEPIRKASLVGAAVDPEAVTKSYYVEDRGQERRYYDDYRKQSLAMRADADRISSRRGDMPTIRAMLAVAEARGWREVRVSGSAEFRREVWIEAQALGMAVQGHRPTDPERQEADRRRIERTQPTPQASRSSGGIPPSPKAEPFHRAKAADDVTPARPFAQPAPEAALSPDGRLVLAALSSKIDRQMVKLTAEAKVELKAFAAAELARKERAEGPVVLTAAQHAMARSPNPARAPSPSRPEQLRPNIEPQRRTRGR